MYFLEGIFRFISGFGRTLSSPFRKIGFKLRTLRTGNPLSRSWFAIRNSMRHMGHYLRTPFSYFGRLFSRFLGLFGVKNDFLDGLGKKSSPGTAGAQAGKKRGVKKKHRPQTHDAQFSQIHLIHQETQQRTVIHIGGTVGQSATDAVLGQDVHTPVNLRFSQVNPQTYKTHIVMTHLAGNIPLWVDGEPIKKRAPIHDETQIKIGHHRYLCELHAWDASSTTTQVDADWATNVGPVRSQNEDAIGIYQHPEAYLFAIADGVGGGEAGERVSEFAMRYLLTVFHKNIQFSSLRWRDIYRQAFNNINAEVRHFARRYSFTAGTTLTSVVIKEWDAHIAHVGDSRLYHWHAKNLRQITTDHCDEVEAVDPSFSTDDGQDYPYRKRDVLTKAIGKNDLMEPDLLTIRLQPGDKLLLCTDGVTDEVGEKELARLVGSMRAEQLAGHLVQLANDRGGKDNASAIAIDVLSHTYDTDNWVAESTERVYVGFSSFWSHRLKRPGELHTSPSFAARITNRILLAGIMVVLAIILGAAFLQGDGETEVTPIEIVSPTPTLTPTPIHSPTTSPVATQTSTPLPTLPPTTPTNPPTSNLPDPPSARNISSDFENKPPASTNGELS
jgi:PPM family protein phosphatase